MPPRDAISPDDLERVAARLKQAGTASIAAVEAVAQVLDCGDDTQLERAGELILLALKVPAPVLLEARRHHVPAVRALALRAVTRERDVPTLTRAIEALTNDAPDADVNVRREQARALGQHGVPAAAAALVRLLEDEDEGVRLAAARSLVVAPLTSPGKRALEAALEGRSEVVASAALEALLVRAPFGALPAIVSSLRHRPALISVAARHVAEVAREAERHACPILETTLTDTNPELRLVAARVLQLIMHRRAATLLATAAEDPDPRVRSCGMVGLSRIDEAWANARVAFAASHDPDPGVRGIAAVRLAKSPGTAEARGAAQPAPLPSVTRTPAGLRAGLGSSDAFVRERAADLLGDAGDAGASGALRRRLEDGSAAVRAAAARALAVVPDAHAQPALLVALDDQSFWRAQPIEVHSEMRGDVAEALAMIGDASVIERLVEFVHSRPTPPRAEPIALRKVVERLVDRTGTSAVAPLCRVLAAQGGAAAFAAELLGRLDDPRGVSALVEALEARDPDIVGTAASALAQSAGPEVFVRLLVLALSIPPDLHMDRFARDLAGLVGSLDGALAKIIERYGAQLPEPDLRRVLDLWVRPDEVFGDIIEQGIGFHRARSASHQEIDRRPQPSPSSPERLQVLHRLADIVSRPPEDVHEKTRLLALSTTWSRWMFFLNEIQAAFEIQLPMESVIRINTVGELVDLIMALRPKGVPLASVGAADGEAVTPRPMLFWQFVSAFRTPEDLLPKVLESEPWRGMYLSLYTRFSELVAKQDRSVLDAPVPFELSRAAARMWDARFVLDPATRSLRLAETTPVPTTGWREMSALEVHDAFGGAAIEEVLEYGSAKV